MKMIKKAAGFWLPLVLVTLYRLVPAKVRGLRGWPGSSGPSTSHLAVAGLWQGYGWAAVRQAVKDNGGYHPER